MLVQKELVHTKNDKYLALTDHVIKVQDQISCSAAATLIIHNGYYLGPLIRRERKRARRSQHKASKNRVLLLE
jgi:hypothetical protein